MILKVEDLLDLTLNLNFYEKTAGITCQASRGLVTKTGKTQRMVINRFFNVELMENANIDQSIMKRCVFLLVFALKTNYPGVEAIFDVTGNI